MASEHTFICPHCGHRALAASRRAGFGGAGRACEKCAFAFTFELLDDYYPAPTAAFFALDREGRIVECGRGSFELTGLSTEHSIGRPFAETVDLHFEDGRDGVATALEWEVRVQAKPVELRTTAEARVRAVADIFPAYDDPEGGVLVVLTPHERRP